MNIQALTRNPSPQSTTKMSLQNSSLTGLQAMHDDSNSYMIPPDKGVILVRPKSLSLKDKLVKFMEEVLVLTAGVASLAYLFGGLGGLRRKHNSPIQEAFTPLERLLGKARQRNWGPQQRENLEAIRNHVADIKKRFGEQYLTLQNSHSQFMLNLEQEVDRLKSEINNMFSGSIRPTQNNNSEAEPENT